MDLRLTGTTALVTGAHRGTGAVIAATLAREGARVIVHGIDRDAAVASAADIAGSLAVWGDLTTDSGAAAVLEACRAETLDILINNYGGTVPGSWLEADTEAWLQAYQINVLSAQRMIRALLPGMLERNRGRIINLGTIGSTRPNAAMPHYYAAKGALANLTLSLAREVAGSGVRVNLVSPGLIRTPEVEAAYLARGRRRGWGETWAEVAPHVAADIPIGRITERQEVADLIAFLASPLADAIHGQNLRIDGGALGTLT